ncbi:MAG: GTP-binding protein, partial [Gaiellaceae bacterium]
LRAISERLTPAIVPLGSAPGLGTRAAGFMPAGAGDVAFRSRLAEALAERDKRILAAYLDDEAGVSYGRLRQALAVQTKRALAHPVFFGSAITGAGVDALMAGIVELLPAAAGVADGSVSGTVFKIERGPAGEKIAYVRMFSGTVRVRDRLRFGRDVEGKVTAISVFDRGAAARGASVSAGEIGKLWGLAEIQIGDPIGSSRPAAGERSFAPPTLETVVVPCNPDDKQALRVALAQLAEQDPLIAVRQDDARQELSVSLYGEIQKEVIQATLANDFALDVGFSETTTICIERPVGTGEVLEILHAKTKTNVTGKSSPTSSNPFLATAGLRVEPAPRGSGVEFRLDVDVRLVPIYIYKTVNGFIDLMTQHVHEALQEGLFGWRVTDCTLTMTDCGYRAPGTTAADFRKLMPLVVMQALERASTVACAPVVRTSLEIPADSIGAVTAALGRLGVAVEMQSVSGSLAMIETILPVASAHELQRQLPGMTGGEGVLESSFAGYQPVIGDQPTRGRTTANPLNRKEYLSSAKRTA